VFLDRGSSLRVWHFTFVNEKRPLGATALALEDVSRHLKRGL